MAVDPLEAGNHLFDLHAAYERGDTLRITMASARKNDFSYGPVFDIDVNLSGAGSLAGIGYLLNHVGFRFVLGDKYTKVKWLWQKFQTCEAFFSYLCPCENLKIKSTL